MGLVERVVWPDTGVLLGLGTDQALLDRFRAHYRGRIRLTQLVARELRAHSEKRLEDGASDDDYDRIAAATRAVQALLIGDRSLSLVGPEIEDLPAVNNVTEQLKALVETSSKAHGGEAMIIVLAAKQAARDQKQHVLLSNDGGASIIADRYGIRTRHMGDVLAEFGCADPNLTPEDWLRSFGIAVRVSAPPARVRPTSSQAFTCVRRMTGCVECDALAKIPEFNRRRYLAPPSLERQVAALSSRHPG